MTKITYDHAQIDVLTNDVVSASTTLQQTLDDLRGYLAPLVSDKSEWTGGAAVAYNECQRKWDESAGGLQQILCSLGRAAGEGNQQMHEADAAAARGWH